MPPLRLSQLLQAPDGVPPAEELDWSYLRGNVVVLEFWATWCGPCVAAIPHMNALAAELEGKAVRFLSVTDESEATIRDFLTRTPMSSWIGIDSDQATHEAYLVDRIPRTLLIDADGRFVAEVHPMDLTVEAIERVIAGQEPQLGLARDLVERRTDEDENAPVRAIFRVMIRPTEKLAGAIALGTGGSMYSDEAVTVPEMLLLAWPEAGSIYRMDLPNDLDVEQHYSLEVEVPLRLVGGFRLVLRDVLPWTFGLAIEQRAKVTEVAVLSVPVGESTKLAEAPGEGFSIGVGQGVFHCSSATLTEMQGTLETLFERPVVSETGLDGEYDLHFTWNPDDSSAAMRAFADGTGIALRLERREVDTLIVRWAEGVDAR